MPTTVSIPKLQKYLNSRFSFLLLGKVRLGMVWLSLVKSSKNRLGYVRLCKERLCYVMFRNLGQVMSG